MNAGSWDYYWTCLVSPEKYAKDNAGFDKRISLEKLAMFFSGDDKRSQFKANVLQRALEHSAASGVQQRDEGMTRFRAFYAQEAEAFFDEKEVSWDKAREAWYGDSWFTFKSRSLPSGSSIVYKAQKGTVELAIPYCSFDSLHLFLEQHPHDPRIIADQAGKTACFCIHLAPLKDFSNHVGARPTVIETLQSVRLLLAFYEANAKQIDTAQKRITSIGSV